MQEEKSKKYCHRKKSSLLPKKLGLSTEDEMVLELKQKPLPKQQPKELKKGKVEEVKSKQQKEKIDAEEKKQEKPKTQKSGSENQTNKSEQVKKFRLFTKSKLEPIPEHKITTYVVLSMAFVVVLILSNISASNTVNFGEFISLSAAEILFPVSYIINDLFVESYGFRRTQRLIIVGLAITLISMFFLYITTLLPTGYSEYQTVFGFFEGGVIGITLASILAYVVGSLANSLIMEKLKKKQGEKRFFTRAIISSVVAEVLDSLVFITFCCLFASAFYDFGRLFQFVFTIAAIKISVELLLFPVTKWLLKVIKKEEDKTIKKGKTNAEDKKNEEFVKIEMSIEEKNEGSTKSDDLSKQQQKTNQQKIKPK